MLLSEEERLLQSTVREFADQVLMSRAAEYDENCQFPWENIRDLASLGLFGLTIDEDFNGNGGTIRQLAIVVEEIARGWGSTSVIYVLISFHDLEISNRKVNGCRHLLKQKK